MKFKKLLLPYLLLFSFGLQAQQIGIHSLSPLSAMPGDTLFLAGRHLGTDKNDLHLSIGGSSAEILSVDGKLLKAIVPATATFGRISLSSTSRTQTTYFDRPFLPTYASADFDFSKLDTNQQLASEEDELYDICSCDFDGDGKVDVASSNNSTAAGLNTVTVYANNSSGPGNMGLLRITDDDLAISQPTADIACADLNGDGKPELLVSQGGEQPTRIYIFVNRSTSSPAAINFDSPLILDASALSAEAGIGQLAVHDFDGDALPEIVSSNPRGQQAMIWRNSSNSGTLSFPAEQVSLLKLPEATYGLNINDIDDDYRAEIMLSAHLGGAVFVLGNQCSPGNLSFGDPVALPLGGRLADLTSGDIDGDTLNDLLVTDFEDGAILLLLNQSTPGNFAFGTPIRMNAALQPWGIELADVTGNQKADILVATLASSDKLIILKNNSVPGDPNFELIQAGNASSYRYLNVADYDGDLRPDIMTTEKDFSANFFISYLRNTSCLQPIILPEDPYTICGSEPLKLSTQNLPGATYQWYLDDSPISGADSLSLLTTTAGNYRVEITDGSCVQSSEELRINAGFGTKPSAPEITTNGPVCEGGYLLLQGPEDGSLNYRWRGPGGFTAKVSKIEINNIPLRSAGLYTLEVQSEGCWSKKSRVFVDVLPAQSPVISPAGELSICRDDSVLLSLAQDDFSELQWYRDDQPLAGATQKAFFAKEAGNYYLKGKSGGDCLMESNTVSISLNAPEAAFSLSSTRLCLGDTLVLRSEAPAGESITWDLGDGQQASSAELSHVYSSPGTYTISHTVSGSSGCSGFREQTVEVIALPEAEIVASADALCPGDSLTLEASGHFSRITWEDGSTDAMRTVGTPGTYQLSAYNDEGCEIVREVTITEAETPLLSIESEGSLQIIRGDSVRLMAFGAETYTWSPAAGLSDSTSASTYASPLQTTTYTLSGWSAEGCSSSVTVTVEVTLDQMRIEPRPVFSPNQDGIEDNWQVEGIELYPDCHFLIFDIQGREVYRSAEDYLNDWQGTDLQGSPLPEGVYYYVFRCSDSRNRKTGSVTLVR